MNGSESEEPQEEKSFFVLESRIPSSRPSKESVLKRLAEALLGRSLTKVCPFFSREFLRLRERPPKYAAMEGLVTEVDLFVPSEIHFLIIFFITFTD